MLQKCYLSFNPYTSLYRGPNVTLNDFSIMNNLVCCHFITITLNLLCHSLGYSAVYFLYCGLKAGYCSVGFTI